MSDEASLKRHKEWLYGKKGCYGNLGPCKCDHAWLSNGRLYGVDMGYGWQRTTTHPDCPNHPTPKRRK